MTETRHAKFWKWWVCGMLLCASAINYMDRQTLSSAASRISAQFNLSQEQYGNLETVFGYAFAVGSLGFGLLADVVSVRILYPLVLAAWSVAGVATGFSDSYIGLMLCRGALGFFEAGHWPCALKTTQRLLAPEDRAMGNSVLQSGTSLGAIMTPLIMRSMMTADPTSWRLAFQAVGGVGLLWVVVWFATVRSGDLAVEKVAETPGSGFGLRETLVRLLTDRRFWVVVIVIVFINTCWQLLRAWLPKFLQEGRGYAEGDALGFSSAFYLASDVGCLGAGACALWLARRGWGVHRSRALAFLGCAMMAAMTTVAAMLPKGPLLLGSLLIAGAGALGVFPCYYALTQELSKNRQGLVSGVTGVFAWALSAPAHRFFGRLIDRSGSFDLGLTLAGWLPMLAFLVLWFGWRSVDEPTGRRSTDQG